MTKLDLDKATIDTLVQEMGVIVERETGWRLDIPNLKIQVVPKERGFEELVIRRITEVGIQLPVDLPKDLFTRIIEYLIENSYLAGYLPGSGSICIVRENVDDSNMDGLRLVIAHELVHRAQHLRFPQLIARMDAQLVDMLKPLLEPDHNAVPDMNAVNLHLTQVEPVMTLFESHAAFIQQRIKERYYPQARIEEHFTLLATILEFLFGARQNRYTRGLPAIDAAYAEGKIDDLFENPTLVMQSPLD